MAIIKRLEVPGFWPIEKKTKKYTVTPLPGPHSKRNALTIAVVLREVLRYAETLREVRELLNAGIIKIDGTVRRVAGFPIGLMDVITIGDEHYRILPGRRGLYLRPLDKKESALKLKKIVGKTATKKGKIQIQFHDGTTLLADAPHKTGDVVIFDVQSRKIKDVIKQEKGVHVIVTKGNNIGTVGILDKIRIVKSSEPNVAEISVGNRTVTLPLNYIFALGKPEPVISVGEHNE
ncbi:MAG: 30S ribosomal protein S4e [Candidatus Aenigmarchaeota archaeon]|nr:30S ribosomal protein S4e [Candidatus Aenigmarchaeota archaeon]